MGRSHGTVVGPFVRVGSDDEAIHDSCQPQRSLDRSFVATGFPVGAPAQGHMGTIAAGFEFLRYVVPKNMGPQSFFQDHVKTKQRGKAWSIPLELEPAEVGLHENRSLKCDGHSPCMTTGKVHLGSHFMQPVSEGPERSPEGEVNRKAHSPPIPGDTGNPLLMPANHGYEILLQQAKYRKSFQRLYGSSHELFFALFSGSPRREFKTTGLQRNAWTILPAARRRSGAIRPVGCRNWP